MPYPCTHKVSPAYTKHLWVQNLTFSHKTTLSMFHDKRSMLFTFSPIASIFTSIFSQRCFSYSLFVHSIITHHFFTERIRVLQPARKIYATTALRPGKQNMKLLVLHHPTQSVQSTSRMPCSPKALS